jgi:hypothetical protein
MVMAANNWLLCFDNVSDFSNRMSDAFCMVATQGALASRELYTDGNEFVLQALRPMAMNGIPDLGDRGDFLSRCMKVTLDPIPGMDEADENEEGYKPESKFWRDFDEACPRIVGALFTAVSTALKNYDHVKVRLPRMGDFCQWVCAAAPALGFTQEEFLEAYGDQLEQQSYTALESSPIGQILTAPRCKLFQYDPTSAAFGNDGFWVGLTSTFIKSCAALAGDNREVQRKIQAMHPNKVVGELRRIKPHLRQVGIYVLPMKRSKHGQLLFIAKGVQGVMRWLADRKGVWLKEPEEEIKPNGEKVLWYLKDRGNAMPAGTLTPTLITSPSKADSGKKVAPLVEEVEPREDGLWPMIQEALVHSAQSPEEREDEAIAMLYKRDKDFSTEELYELVQEAAERAKNEVMEEDSHLPEAFRRKQPIRHY